MITQTKLTADAEANGWQTISKLLESFNSSQLRRLDYYYDRLIRDNKREATLVEACSVIAVFHYFEILDGNCP